MIWEKTVTPANCRVALKALNHWFKSGHPGNTFRLFLTDEESAHRYQSKLPFLYALGQSLSYNHAHCRGSIACHNPTVFHYNPFSILFIKDEILFSISFSSSACCIFNS